MCTRRVPNSERRVLRDKYPLPKVPATRPAQLSCHQDSRQTACEDTTLLLYSLAPFTSIVQAHHNGDTLDQKEAIQAVRLGITLFGNTNAHLLHLQRERIVGEINKALLPIVGDDSNFKEAAPLLFGTEFAKKSKEKV